MAKPMKTLELHSSMIRFLIMQFLNNSLQLAGKFVRIFVRRHQLFREANTLTFEKQIMPKGKHPDKFSRQMEAIMILQTVFATSAFLKLKLGNVIQIFPSFRPIAGQRKYLMDYKDTYDAWHFSFYCCHPASAFSNESLLPYDLFHRTSLVTPTVTLGIFASLHVLWFWFMTCSRLSHTSSHSSSALINLVK